MKTSFLKPSPGEAWNRDQLLDLLAVSAAIRENAFIRKTTTHWLSVYPGDLPVQLYQVRAKLGEGRPKEALNHLDKICRIDPEYLEAQQLRAQVAKSAGPDQRPAWGELYALHPNSRVFKRQNASYRIPEWAQILASIRKNLSDNKLDEALSALPELLGSDPPSALGAVTHLQILLADPNTPQSALLQFAEHYHQKWPDNLACRIILANALVQTGSSDQAVSMLHQTAAEDISGQITRRTLGDDHPYRDLWPTDLKIHLDLRIPAPVAAAMGWNQLPSGPKPKFNEPPPADLADLDLDADMDEKLKKITRLSTENLEAVTEELNKVVEDLETKSTVRTDDRFPMYIVFSTRKGLEKKYGPETTEIILEEMKKTTYAIRLKPGWGAVMLLADDPSSMANFGLKPILPDDPWALKLALTDLDQSLAENGLMIGAVLIVGGPEVVPFHNLPNPVEDNDALVPSDNPYATTDENYFIPEWPVGRLPGGAGNDPGLLLDMLRHITENHMGKPKDNLTFLERILAWFIKTFSLTRETNFSFGYAAEAWKKASDVVFSSIQENRNVITSPPFGKHAEIPVPVTRLGYFNLHGVEESSEWYGQKDLTNGSAGPDYPIALRPEDINAYEDAPLFVFSEACYGVHLDGRKIEDSIALKYLSRGSHAVVGSTVTAYGSVDAPLIAADLLAERYWIGIQKGYGSGIALQNAKIEVAREMNNRQGYLDGEDQKTLISFIHFGDPLASPETARRKQPKSILVPRIPPVQVPTVCDRSTLTTDIPSNTLKQVKKVVKRYLPGMEDAEMVLGTEKNVCAGGGHQCATAKFPSSSPAEHAHQRQVVTLSKQFEIPQNSGKTIHRHYARVTFDQSGKMVKLAVSR
jgi:hypothetical protein